MEPTIPYNPAPPINPLEQQARILAIKNMMTQGQEGQQQLIASTQENTMRAQQIKDQQTVMQTLSQNGGDLAAALPQLAGKVTPQTYMGLAKAHYETREAALKMTSEQLGLEKTQNDNLLGLIDQAKALPPDQYAQQWPAIAQRAVQIKPEIAKQINPNQPVPQQALDQFAIGIQAHSTIQAQVMKEREVKATELTAQSHADQAATAKERLAAEMPGGALADPAKAELADWLKKNPGKGPADFLKYKASIPITMQQSLLTPQATAMAGQMYQQTGQLPTGMRSPGMSAGILNNAAGAPGAPTPNIAANKMSYGADVHSLDSLQKNFDQVTAFENTAGKNLDVFLSTAKKVVDSGSPLVNTPLRNISAKVAGSENMAAFNAARVTALTEISKVLNSSNASGVLSDSARGEVAGLIGPNATLGMIYKAAGILKTDMANRHQAYSDQIAAIKQRGGGQAAPAPTQASGATRTYQGHTYSQQSDGSWKLQQ
jgi:hypothetical protein